MSSESSSRNNSRLNKPPKDKSQELDSSNTCTIERRYNITSQLIIAESVRDTRANTRETGNEKSESLIRNAPQLQLNYQRISSCITKCKENKSFIRNIPEPIDLEQKRNYYMDKKKKIATATIRIKKNQHQIQPNPQDRESYSPNKSTPFLSCSPLRSNTPDAYRKRQMDEDNERKRRQALTRSSAPPKPTLTYLKNEPSTQQ